MKKLPIHFAIKFFLLPGFFALIIPGCKKEELITQPVLDKEAFFTISIDAVEYATYGYYDKTSNNTYGGPTMSTINAQDASGNTFKIISLEAKNFYTRSGSQSTSDSLQLGNCTLRLGMKKNGNELPGLYDSFTGNISDHKITNNAYEEFYFEPGFCRLEIIREVNHPANNAKMVEGYFTCRLFTSAGGFRYINTAGNFRMYLK